LGQYFSINTDWYFPSTNATATGREHPQ
jgi:hypothetical protein